MKCSGRMNNHFQGPAQQVNMGAGRLYKLVVYLKQLNDMPGKLFQLYRATITYTWGNNENSTNVNVAFQPEVRSANGWFRLAGFFRSPSKEFVSSLIRVHGPDISIEFLVDDASLVELQDDANNWRQEADQRIQQLRMGEIHFRFNLPLDVHSSEIDVQVDHKRHQFGFGTLVKDQWMTDSAHTRYQETVYELFNTATTQAVKWLFDKGTPGHPDYQMALACIDELNKHGMLVRAHNLFWGGPQYLPGYILHYTSLAQLNTTVHERLRYLVNATGGKVDHWDVVNELLHHQWFEEQFRDPDLSQGWYRDVHSMDPRPLLMLNEYEILARPETVDAYLQQAQQYLSRGVPLHGLGIQGHFHTQVPDPSLIKMYLDHLSMAGLPLWVTELDVYETDAHVRADHYETVLRLFFSHPSVEGIVFWGFWDHHTLDRTSSLADGPDVVLNEAGHRYLHLVKEEWSTHVNMSLTSGPQFDLRGFKGDYEVVVRRNGEVVKTLNFSLNGTSTTVNIDLQSSARVLNGNDPTFTGDLPPGVAQTAQKDENGGFVIGTATSSASTASLTCANQYSGLSDVVDEAYTQSVCRNPGEVLTSCSSVLKNQDWHKEGEQITTDRAGHISCRAVDGVGATGGVQAVTRCCTQTGMTCTYRVAGPSPPGVGSTVEVRCLPGEIVLGCSAWGAHNHGGGVWASNTSCAALNSDLQSGVYSYAVCCTAPNLSCVTMTSVPGVSDHVSCPHGYTLTGCNFFTTRGAKAAGASLLGDGSCRAFAANTLTSGQTVQAQAICCRTV